MTEIPEILDPRTGELMDTDSVPGLATVAQLHDEQICQLSSIVEQLQDDSGGPLGSTGPYVWHTLAPADAEKLWSALADWVGWLRGRYPLARQVPLCWWRHPELVEELTALWLAWREAYTEKGAPLTAAADWHGRWLPEVLRRVGAGGWNIACEGEHKERIKSLYDDRRVDDELAFRESLRGEAAQWDQPMGGSAREGKDQGRNGEAAMDDETMRTALETGDARAVGELADSPVAYSDTYWVPGEDGWVEVVDPDTIAFLSDADRRMRLADEALARIDEQ